MVMVLSEYGAHRAFPTEISALQCVGGDLRMFCWREASMMQYVHGKEG